MLELKVSKEQRVKNFSDYQFYSPDPNSKVKELLNEIRIRKGEHTPLWT